MLKSWRRAGKCRRRSSAAAVTSSVHPVGWTCATIVVIGIVGKSVGLVVLFLAAGLADLTARAGTGRRAVAIVVLGLVGVFAGRAVVEAFKIDMTEYDPFIMIGGATASLFVVIPACQFVSVRDRSVVRLDAVLSIYLVAEVLLVLVMCRASAGAWINYGIQAVIFASLLAARALARTCASATCSSRTVGDRAGRIHTARGRMQRRGVERQIAGGPARPGRDRSPLQAARRRVLLRGSTRYQSPERQARPGV